MKTSVLILLAVSMLFALGVAAEAPLSFTIDAPEMLSGSFSVGDSMVFFSAQVAEKNRTNYVIQVNSVSINATLDNLLGTLTIDGRGSHILQTERGALVALASAMEDRFSARAARPHEDMLMSLINYLSEAPAGYAFEKMVVNRAEGESKNLDSSGNGTRACYQSDNDNTQLSGGCSYRSYSSQHDADGGGHCFATFSVSGGCRLTASCPGRCGAGCGTAGKGKYYMDCLDHDKCCGSHGGCTNPFDTECGDEYREAAWEFTFGSTNCSNGC